MFEFDIVDCQWSDWVVGQCSLSCGGGVRTNTRSEKVVANSGGRKCIGTTSDEEKCNEQNCTGKNFHPK